MSRVLEFLRGLKRALMTRPAAAAAESGVETVLTGSVAVARIEAAISEACPTAASHLGQPSVSAFAAEVAAGRGNAAGLPLSLVPSDSPRGSLATAMGLAMAGTRATAFLTAADLQAGQDLLVAAAEQHLSLVIHASGGARAWQAAADTGWIILWARSVQEAVDLSLLGRRLSEEALLPVLLLMDDRATAQAMQEVRLPTPQLLHQYIGDPDDRIASPTPAQELLFGAERRRLPRWYDLENPVLQAGRRQGLAAAADRPFFGDHAAQLFEQAVGGLTSLTGTGRSLEPISTHAMEGAYFVLLAQGAVVETAEAVADHLRQSRGMEVGVLGLRCLRPFPAQDLIPLLRRKRAVAVLEAAASDLASEPPLARELRAALAGACLPEHEQPRIQSALFGLGGLPLRAADLESLCLAMREGLRQQVYLGVDFDPGPSQYPKRAALQEDLRRSYSGLAELGLTAGAGGICLPAAEGLGIASYRGAASGGEDYALAAATLLHGLFGGRLRSRLAPPVEGFGAVAEDRLYLGDEELGDPGDAGRVDVAVLLDPLAVSLAADQVAKGAALVMAAGSWDRLDGNALRRLYGKEVQLYEVEVAETEQDSEAAVAEEMLGALLGLVAERRREFSSRKARRLRASTLEVLDEDARQRRLAAFEAGMTLRAVDWQKISLPAEAAASTKPQTVTPMAARRLGGGAESYASLPRFWDQAGVLYRDGAVGQLSPDPFLALSTLPPLSAAFQDHGLSRKNLPVFDPLACTGCGDCWVACPDAAIGAVVFGFAGLLDAGMARAREIGGNADALRMLASKLTSRAAQLMAKEPVPPSTVAAALEPAFDWVLQKMAPPEDRRQSLTAAFGDLLQAVGDCQISVTDPYFKGSGQLLSLAINPQGCKGCMACVEVCEPAALSAEVQTPELDAATQKAWEIYCSGPETSPEALEALEALEAGSAAALLLRRSAALSMSGGDGVEAGSGGKLALRLLLASAEAHMRPRLEQQLAELTQLRGQFDAKIQELLAESLPTGSLADLAASLRELDARHVELGELTRKVEEKGGRRPVDAVWLATLVTTAAQLEELQQRWLEGQNGLGRSTAGLVLSGGTASELAGAFPYNPFPLPVVTASGGEAIQLALGLAHGQLCALVSDFRLLRRARLELQRLPEAQRAAADLQSLRHADLTEEEREFCPPLLLVGGDDALGLDSLSQLSTLLGSEWPLKVMVLADLDLGLADQSGLGRENQAAGTAWPDLGLLATTHRRAFVLQSSIGYPDHLVQGMQAAMTHPGPALIHVHAPSPRRHGFSQASAMAQARRVVQSRSLPLFVYDPKRADAYGACLDLSGNPAAEEETTLAEWALSEARFAAQFQALEDGDASPLPLSEYLELEAGEKQDHSAYLLLDEQKLRILPALVAAADERLQSWRCLEELTTKSPALVIPSPPAAAQGQVGQPDLDALRQEYEAKIQGLRAEFEREFTARLQRRLVELSRRQRRQLGAPR